VLVCETPQLGQTTARKRMIAPHSMQCFSSSPFLDRVFFSGGSGSVGSTSTACHFGMSGNCVVIADAPGRAIGVLHLGQ